MPVNNKELVIAYLLLVHFFKGFLCILRFLEAYISVVLQLLVLVSLYIGRLDFTELREQVLQFVIISTLGKILDEQILEFASLWFSLILLLVGINLDPFTSQIISFQCLLSFLCFLLGLELDVRVSFALTILVGLEFAGYDVSVLSEQIEEFLLSHILVNVLDQKIGFFIIVEFAL
jgi:hypothetical protein